MQCCSIFVYLSILSGAANFADGFTKASCESPQYLTFGNSGTLNCVFDEEFFSVLWFNTTDYSSNDAILHYQNSIKTGPGYVTGEYDIHQNGSLIINDVSLQHETVFTVAYIYTKKEDSVILRIFVIVVVKPEVHFPEVEHCGNHSKTCYAEIASSSTQCAVKGARPNITLQWMARTVNGDKPIPYQLSNLHEGLTSTSVVTATDIFHYSTLLTLLVCKAISPPGVLESNETLMLAENEGVDYPNDRAISKYIERHTKMILNCTVEYVGFIVWKKAVLSKETQHDLLGYSVLLGESFKEIFAKNVSLGRRGSYIIPHANLNDEGLYYCIFGDGIKDGVAIHNVTVIVYPWPPYLAVDGCSFDQECALEAQTEGRLTCTVIGIRPRVQLKWKPFYERDATSVHFTNQEFVVKENKDTFDITLTASYRVIDRSREQLTVTCALIDPPEIFFHLQRKVDLLFVNDTTTEYIDVPLQRNIALPVALVIVFLLLLLSFVVMVVLVLKRIRHRRNSLSKEAVSQKEEIMPMVSSRALSKDDMKSHDNETDLKELKRTFINQLKEKYRDLYSAVRPIPYIRDRMYCVENIFVEGGLEILHHDGGPRSLKLDSYTDIFKKDKMEFSRLILEGEPGYGKSTITLQLVYDWCNKKQSSYIKDTDIVILLRMRQLGRFSSIFKAIKYLLLPYDSLISEKDINIVLNSTESLVIILDGYDEYPDREKPSSDIMKVFERSMFQKCQVILTTRRFSLPPNCSSLTKRVLLKGFDDSAQESYIRKALVMKENQNVGTVKSYLLENPVLSGLCQVPLFFVMYAHIVGESETLITFNSVTTFFQQMITCFHEHAKLKMDDVNVEEHKLFENDHQKLDKVAFDALSTTDSQIVWMKEGLRKRLGKKFYEAYVRIGMLVEEETPSGKFVLHPGSNSVQKKTEVRFYHKLFCEWYAAHFLSSYASKSLPIRLGSIIKKTNPFNNEYLCRFACGLDPYAAGKIIKHIKKLDGGDKFAILCIMEQTETFDNVKDTIRQLCANGVVISDEDSLFLQTSSLQLLKIAATCEVPITLVRLHNCMKSVDLSKLSIKLKSDLELFSKIPIEILQISHTMDSISEEEATSILEFSSKCLSLKALWFLGCNLPECFQTSPTLTTLESNNVEVYWRSAEDKPRYSLNFLSGKWETSSLIKKIHFDAGSHLEDVNAA